MFNRKEYHKKFYAANQERNKQRKRSSPWIKSYRGAYSRCNTPSHDSYASYGAKGIKLLATEADFKVAWYRDKAESMKSPSIDRIDPNGDYIIDNIRYVELDINLKRPKRK